MSARRHSPLDELVLGMLPQTGPVTADELASRLSSHRFGVLDSLRRLSSRGLVRCTPAKRGQRRWGDPMAPSIWEAAPDE